MKRFCFWVILPLCLFIGCKGSSSSEPVTGLSVQSLEIIDLPDSMSSRALFAWSADEVMLVGTNHNFVSYDQRRDSNRLQVVKIDTGKNDQYRAIERTSVFAQVVNIGSPTHVYKSTLDRDGFRITYTDTSKSAFYNTIRFFDDHRRGLITGDPQDGCLSILRTTDGGDSWTKIPCEDLPPTEIGEANFAASNTCIDMVESHAWIVTGGAKARVFHSPDYGQTWEVFDTPITQGGQMTGIYSVDFYDENLGVIYGGDWENKGVNTGNKAITRDGGKTWELLADGEGPGYRSCIQFYHKGNGQVLLATGSEGIDYSLDQGQTWQRLSDEGFYAMDFSYNHDFMQDDDVVWLSGRGRMARLELNVE